jgi:ankyrin repeat protein
MLERLMSLGADINHCFKAQDLDFGTPLTWASLCADIEAAKLLVARGADVNIADRKGRSPLMRAAESGNEDMVMQYADQARAAS